MKYFCEEKIEEARVKFQFSCKNLGRQKVAIISFF